MNLGLLIGGISFFLSCLLFLFSSSKRYVLFPRLIVFIIGLILIPLGFKKELGFLSMGFGMLVPSFFGIVVALVLHYTKYLSVKNKGI